MRVRTPSRRGFTFLEVVLAAALIALVASGIASVFGFVISTTVRERHRLAAYEVANRLVIAYLDDPTKLPDPNKPLEYGPAEAPLRWRWQLRQEPVGIEEIVPAGESAAQGGVGLDRFLRVVVRVWLSEESGGAASPDGSVPVAELSRLVDPVALRNPDAVARLMSDPDAMRNLLGNISGTNRQGITGQIPQAGQRPPRQGGGRPPGAFGQGGPRQPGGGFGRGFGSGFGPGRGTGMPPRETSGQGAGGGRR